MLLPPLPNSISGESTGVMTGTNVDIANVEREVVQPMRNGNAIG